MSTLTIFISAGEASGDTHGAGVVRELKVRYPEAVFFGIGGDRMQEAGLELIEHAGRMSFMGFAEVIRHLPFILATRTRVLAEIVKRKPDLILLIDYPGFHFSLLRRLKRMGLIGNPKSQIPNPSQKEKHEILQPEDGLQDDNVGRDEVQDDKSREVVTGPGSFLIPHPSSLPKILYYIPPQVWAWKAGRAKVLAEMADRIAVIFPFEVEIFEVSSKLEIRNSNQKTHSKQRTGAEILQPEDGLQDDKERRVRFVGHPLLDEVGEIQPRGQFLKSIGLEPDDRVVGLFPGSRKQEVRRHLPILVKTAKLLRTFQPDLKFILAESPHVPDHIYARVLRDTPGIQRAVGMSHEILAHCNASIVKSGSTTIEAAYFGNPFVVFYKVTPLSYALGKRVIKVPFIAMANILAGERVVKELIQDQATPENLFAAMLPLLSFPHEIEKCRAGLRKVREKLGEPGAAKKVAEIAAELLEENEKSKMQN